MDKTKMDVLDKYFLMHQIENIILELDGKKRGYLTNDKLEIQIGMWLKLLQLLKDYDEFDKNHKFVFDVENVGEISDGSHTFNELYAHRASLFAVICNTYPENAWKSWKHHHEENFPMYEDYFIVGVNTPEGQYSYHYHKDWWDKFKVQELEEAPKFDGHQPDDVDRLFSLVEEKNKDE